MKDDLIFCGLAILVSLGGGIIYATGCVLFMKVIGQ